MSKSAIWIMSILVVAAVAMFVMTPAIVLLLVPITGTDPNTSSSAGTVFFGSLALGVVFLIAAAAVWHFANKPH